MALVGVGAAQAQRTNENAVTSAEDAFGTSVGDYNLGLYNPNDVRGFSADAAGNIRLDGLYIDRQADFTSHLIGGSTIRVGPSAQGYPFPAPTGIADFKPRRAGAKPLISPNIAYGAYGGLELEVDTQLPVSPTLSLTSGAGLYWLHNPSGSKAFSWSAALAPRWQPSRSIELIPFWSTIHYSSEASPLVFVSGHALPPHIERGLFYGQHWARFEFAATNSGLIGTANLASSTTLRLGAFRSVFDTPRGFGDLFLDTGPAGSAHHVLIANQHQKFASWSGELRLSTLRTEGERRHLIYLSARARDLTRKYGGADILNLGAAKIGVPNPIAEPAFEFGPQTRDRVRQLTLGLGYDLEWTRIGTLSAGVQTSRYSKSVEAPGLSPVKSRDHPLLFNLGTTVSLTPDLSLYGSYTRGFEEGGVAPSVAVNRNEAAPALRTTQKDAGVRLKLGKSVRAVAGLFDIQKPYYGIDGSNVYRRLGALRNRGVEVSVAGEVATGLNVVVGAVLKNPTLAVTDAELVRFGKQPLGTNRRTFLASLDYRLQSMPALSFDASLSNSGAAVASIDNLLKTRPQTQLDVGARYRLHIGASPATLRVGIGNLLNSFAWNVDNSGAMWASSQRSVRITLATDISPGREPG